MKAFIISIILCTILMLTLGSKSKVTEGDIHKMLQGNFKMEAKFCGCFGCGTNKVSVYKKTGKRMLKLTYDESGENKALTFEFTQAIATHLDSLLVNRINYPRQGYCTTSTEYTFRSGRFRFRIFDGGCSLGSFFNDLALIHRSANES